MKAIKSFFTTNNDGENPAVITLSLFIGVALALMVIWGLKGFPQLPPISKIP